MTSSAGGPSRHAVGAVVGSALALASGAALAALDALRILPVVVRDAALPLLSFAVVLCCAALAAAVQAREGRRAALVFAVVACVGTACAGVRAASASPLPPSSPDLPRLQGWPDLELRDADDAPFSLSSLRGAPAVVVFFRGASCPYCRAQLRALADEAPRWRRAGVRVIAISPDPVTALHRMRGELGEDVALLSDESELSIARSCNGRMHCAVVVDPDGATVWAGVSESWSDVPAPAVLLEAAWRTRTVN